MWQKCLAGMGCCVSYQFTACQLQIHPPALALPIMDSSPQALLLPCERNAEVSQWRALEGLAAARGRPTVSGTCRVGSACGYEDTWWGPQPRTKKGQSLSNLAALAWSSVTFQWPCQHRHYALRASCYSPPSHTSLCGLLPMMWPRPSWRGCHVLRARGTATATLSSHLHAWPSTAAHHQEGCHQGSHLLCAPVAGYRLSRAGGVLPSCCQQLPTCWPGRNWEPLCHPVGCTYSFFSEWELQPWGGAPSNWPFLRFSPSALASSTVVLLPQFNYSLQ